MALLVAWLAACLAARTPAPVVKAAPPKKIAISSRCCYWLAAAASKTDLSSDCQGGTSVWHGCFACHDFEDCNDRPNLQRGEWQRYVAVKPHWMPYVAMAV